MHVQYVCITNRKNLKVVLSMISSLQTCQFTTRCSLRSTESLQMSLWNMYAKHAQCPCPCLPVNAANWWTWLPKRCTAVVNVHLFHDTADALHYSI